MKNYNNKKGLTLAELIIATLISAMVLTTIVIYIQNILESSQKIQNDVYSMGSFYDFTFKLDNYSDIYEFKEIIYNENGESDIILFTDENRKSGILFGLVEFGSLKLDTNTNLIGNKTYGFRLLSENEINNIDSDVNYIFNLNFQNDMLQNNINLVNLNFEKYNSSGIIEMISEINLNYNKLTNGTLLKTFNKDNILKNYYYF